MTDSFDQPTTESNHQSGWLRRFIQSTRRSDIPFFSCFILLGAAYIALIAAMLVSDVAFTSLKDFFPTLFSVGWWGVFSPAAWAEAFEVASKDFRDAFASEEIRYSFYLSLISCTISAVLSVIVAVPIMVLYELGILLARLGQRLHRGPQPAGKPGRIRRWGGKLRFWRWRPWRRGPRDSGE